MDNPQTTPQTTPAPASGAAPAQQQPAFVQPQPYIPPPAAAGDVMAEGGEVAKKFDYVEIGFMILGVAGICLVIYYYVQKSKQSKQMAAALPAITNRMTEAEKKITMIGKRLGIAA